MPSSQGIEQARQLRTTAATHLFQAFNPRLKSVALIDREYLVRTQRRINAGWQAAGPNRLMSSKVIGRIIRRTNDRDPEFFEDPMHREFLELLVGLRPDPRG